MSRVRKMKLVPIDHSYPEKDNNFLIKTLLSDKPNEVLRINILDDSMREILNLNIDEEDKLKLFTQALNKYMFLKEKLESGKTRQSENTVNSTDSKEISPITSKLFTPQIKPTQIDRTKSPHLLFPRNITSISKQRKVKAQAQKNIKKYYEKEDSSEISDKNESYSGWIPFNSPKKFKRLPRK